MVLKSSDSDSKDESSSEPQMTEDMEASTGISSSLPRKRKAESPTNLDSGESDSESDGNDRDEEMIDLEDSDSYWDKDSFDGRVYHSSDESELLDKDLQERCRFYNRTVIETKGFFERSDKFPQSIFGISDVSERDLEEELREGMTGREFIAKMASKCVEKYNIKKGKNVKLEHVLRANFFPGGRGKYYITFTARESESSDAPLVEYQAKVFSCGGETYPILCRPTPPPPTKSGSVKEVGKVTEEIS